MERKIYNIKRGWLFKTKRDFAKRWNIEIEDRFYERCITLIGDIINPKQLSELEQKIFLIVGEIYKGERSFQVLYLFLIILMVYMILILHFMKLHFIVY